MRLLSFFVIAAFLPAQTPAPTPAVSGLPQVRRIFVAPLVGGPSADSLRELIIAGLDSTGRFVLTENQDKADAVLKGAADDHSYTDSFDSTQSLSDRENGGKRDGSSYSKTSGIYGGLSVGDSESKHIREHKHEAFAAVRLCNRDGDVLWSTIQESDGAKFRGAGADVASKIARQLSLDFDRLRRETRP